MALDGAVIDEVVEGGGVAPFLPAVALEGLDAVVDVDARGAAGLVALLDDLLDGLFVGDLGVGHGWGRSVVVAVVVV